MPGEIYVYLSAVRSIACCSYFRLGTCSVSSRYVKSLISLCIDVLMCVTAQEELLNRAQANGEAAEGKYTGGAGSSAAAESNFVAQHAY